VTDPVRRYLTERRVARHVVEGGLDYLVERWTRVATWTEAGAEWYWEEWVNELDGREILQGVLDDVPEAGGGAAGGRGGRPPFQTRRGRHRRLCLGRAARPARGVDE
jgi:hypothetical protein